MNVRTNRLLSRIILSLNSETFVQHHIYIFSLDKPVIRILSDTSTCEPHASPSNTCYITKGQNVNLVCEAESNPIPALFQWSEKYISNNKKLQILSAHVSKHEGRYRCTVSTTIHDESDSRLPLSSSYLFTVIVQGK